MASTEPYEVLTPFTMPCCGRRKLFGIAPRPGEWVYCTECDLGTRLPPRRRGKKPHHLYGTTRCCGEPVLRSGACAMCLDPSPLLKTAVRKGRASPVMVLE